MKVTPLSKVILYFVFCRTLWRRSLGEPVVSGPSRRPRTQGLFGERQDPEETANRTTHPGPTDGPTPRGGPMIP